MVTYFLFTPDLSCVTTGSYSDCVALGDRFTLSNAFPLLKIARARGGEPDATIIFDVSEDSRRQSTAGRRVSRQKLVQASKHSPFPA
jgi:hypothetical protein